MEGARRLIVCLTPVKDEAWILDRFLRCAATWADHIIVADHGSIDGSRAIALDSVKTKLIEIPLDRWDERVRQRLLIDATRSIPNAGKLTMIALNADEALSANWRSSPEWDKLLRAAPGTVSAFRRLNLLPDCSRGSFSDKPMPLGFVDDGTPHRPEIIHGPRLPIPEGAPWMVFEDIKVLHYQYTDWARMKSKQRWYQCWERVTFPAKRAVSIYRQYHHMDAAKDRAVEIDPAWVEEFEDYNASMLEADSASHYRWNEDVLAFLSERGVAPFRKLAIWDVNWADTSILGSSTSSMGLEDPRSWFDKLIHKWLQRTQPNAHRMDVRIVQKLLQLIGW